MYAKFIFSFSAHIVLAFVFGELFVFTQHGIFSLLMALAFLGAFTIYAKLQFSKAERNK